MPRPAQASDGASAARAWLGFAILVMAQFAFGPLIRGPVAPDFLLIAVLFSAVRMRPGFAVLIGFLVGLLIDALAPMHFGASTLVLTALAFAASWLKAAFFSDNIAVTGLFVFAGKWLYDIAMAGVAGRFQGDGLTLRLLVWSPLSALVTAGVAVLLLSVLRSLYRPPTR